MYMICTFNDEGTEIYTHELSFFTLEDVAVHVGHLHKRRALKLDVSFVINSATFRTWEIASDDNEATVYLSHTS